MSGRKIKLGKIEVLDIVIAVFFFAYFLSFFFYQSPKAEAGEAGSMFGYAWSENIGWVSFNCADPGTCATSNYKIDIDSGGNLSGYAWSENIGWIQAYTSGSGCPQTPCAAKISGSQMQGWFKAVSGGSGGWDGWISLSGTGYAVILTGTNFSGYAWGSDVVGWLDFQYARTTYLETCAETDICANGDLSHKNPDCSVTFIRTCLNGCANGTSCNPECSPSTVWSCGGQGNKTIIRTDTNMQCQVTTTDIATCDPPAYCSAGSSICLYPTMQFGENGHLQLDPSLISTSGPVVVYWDVDNVVTCSVTGTNGDGTGSNGTGTWNAVTGNNRFWAGPQGKTSSVIDGHTTYTLSCTGLDGSNISESTSVDVTPVFEER